MKKFNVLSSGRPSKQIMAEDKINAFNNKMKGVAVKAADNSRKANESASRVMLTR